MNSFCDALHYGDIKIVFKFYNVMIPGRQVRGRTATQRSKKGSEKVLGRVLGKGSEKESENGACYRFYHTKGF